MIQATRLYIKRHSITGLKYLGKTVKKNPYAYNGSGKYWKHHINKYGIDNIETLWVSEEFTDKDSLLEFATFLSEELNIANSDEWANLKPETGLDGGVGNGKYNPMYGKYAENNPNFGKIPTQETKLKISKALKGKQRGPISSEHKKNIAKSLMGKKGNNTKYCDADFIEILNDYSLGYTKFDLVKKYSNRFSRSTIYKVLKNKG